MNKAYISACGIALSSVILTNVGSGNRQQTLAANTEQGTLTLVANGEDFVRQGFVTKDGWSINFDHAYVNISNASAYQTEPSFEPETGDTPSSIEYQDKMDFDSAQTVDLATGADTEPILVAEQTAPTGFYNALTWKLSPADASSPISGQTIALLGQATKDGETVEFDLSFNQPTEYVCGEFVGEERQGIVATDTPGQVEATFHFDHIFGDADTPENEKPNLNSLGFQPLADLASNGTIKLDDAALSSQLSAEDYQKLTEAVAGLGHVGEGHCEISTQ